MSKFFDATQRVAGESSAPELDVIKKLRSSDPLDRPPQTVEEETGDNLISVEASRDDALEGPVDSVFGVAGAVVESSGVSTTDSLRENSINTAGRPVSSEPSSLFDMSASDRLEKPLHPAYERITQRLLAFRAAPRQSVILIAGAVTGEGASTIARNTAETLGLHRKERILLVDANLRAPSQHRAFANSQTDGLSDVIAGSISLTSAVKNDVRPGLSLLTAGNPVESPPHLLTQSVVQSIVMALTSLFDWVIVDGPPLTKYPETASLAAASGGALLVVRAERTRFEVADEAKRVLEDSGVHILGAVLNRRKYHIPAPIYRRL